MVFVVLGVAAVVSAAAMFKLLGSAAVATRRNGTRPPAKIVAQPRHASRQTPVLSVPGTETRAYVDYIASERHYNNSKLRYAEQTRRQGAVTAAQRAMLEERLRNAGKVVELFKLVGDQSTSGPMRLVVLVRRVQPWYDKRARELVAQKTGLGPDRRLPMWLRIVNQVTGGARKGECDTLCRYHETEIDWYEQQQPTARYYLDNHLDTEARDALRSALIHHLYHAFGPNEPLVWY